MDSFGLSDFRLVALECEELIVDFVIFDPNRCLMVAETGLKNCLVGSRDRSVGRHAQMMAVASCSQSQNMLSMTAPDTL
jgi:hypothetical protein